MTRDCCWRDAPIGSSRPDGLIATLLGLVLGVVLAACTAAPTARLVVTPPATPTPGPTPTPLLTLPPDYKLPRTWTVSFVAIGSPKVTETYVLEPTCQVGLCDAATTILTRAGKKIGSGTFRFGAGAFTFEDSRETLVECEAPGGTVSQGAEAITTTRLVIAPRREQGSAYVYVGLVGTRTVDVVPVTANGCASATTTYAARGQRR